MCCWELELSRLESSSISINMIPDISVTLLSLTVNQDTQLWILLLVIKVGKNSVWMVICTQKSLLNQK